MGACLQGTSCHKIKTTFIIISIWYSVFNNALPVEHRGSSIAGKASFETPGALFRHSASASFSDNILVLKYVNNHLKYGLYDEETSV